MAILKQLTDVVFYFSLSSAIPSALLYPLALWVARNTSISGKVLAQSYFAGIGLLWFPTAFLVEFL
jgi:hypothetical protein